MMARVLVYTYRSPFACTNHRGDKDLFEPELSRFFVEGASTLRTTDPRNASIFYVAVRMQINQEQLSSFFLHPFIFFHAPRENRTSARRIRDVTFIAPDPSLLYPARSNLRNTDNAHNTHHQPRTDVITCSRCQALGWPSTPPSGRAA